MDKIEFDEKTRATIMELKRNIDFLQTQLNLICQVVLNMSGADGEWQLSPDLSGLVRISDEEHEQVF